MSETKTPRAIHQELLRFAPLIYHAWSDGALSSEEIAAIGRRAAADDRLDDGQRDMLSLWLDPTSPPSPSDLEALLGAIREAGVSLSDDARDSLTRMGDELSRKDGREGGRREIEAIGEMESALGIVGAEASRSLLPVAADAVPPPEPRPAFDPSRMHALLDGQDADIRERTFEILSSDEFAYGTTGDLIAYRERVLGWCRTLAANGLSGLALPREFGGEDDIARSIAVFETLAYHDLSLLVKFGVQFGLFGGSILQLGTRRHHQRYLADMAALRLPGCFAMTEAGHGSNVRDIRTTARYDREAREFVIHTPAPDAYKDWIGNAGMHGRLATVFAQLEVDGAHHGVHALLVPIRDESGRAMPGVRLEDCGLKEGLNGVDNGRIWFDQVRVPRENLLNRFGDVAEDGTYASPIPSQGRRFFTMLGTLVAGRISIAAAAVSAAKSGLTIAVRHAATRRQFGPEGMPEVPILDYLSMQRRLLPPLATTYAVHFAVRELIGSYSDRGTEPQEVEALAAGLKAYISRHTVRTLQECREACGGQGYLAVNRLPSIKADTDVFTTFEGANAVLGLLVARGMLTEYREHFGELRVWGVMRYVTGRAASALADLNPIAPRRTDEDHLRDPDFHAATLEYREQRLRDSLARRLQRRIESGEDSFDALNACQDHALELADAHIERRIQHAFRTAIDGVDDPTFEAVLRPLSALYALSVLERERGWFLERGYFESAKSKAIRDQVNRLCDELRPHAVTLVDAFGIPDRVLAAPIALR